MRRGSILIIVAALVGLLLPATALAAKPQRFSDQSTAVFCGGLSGADGSASAFAVSSDREGGWGQLTYWSPGDDPESDAPTWVTGSSAVVLNPDGSVLEAAFTLFEYDPIEDELGDLVGDAVMTADLTPVGDPYSFSFKDRSGNRVERVEGTVQLLAVAGTLALPGQIEFDLAGCEAARQSLTIFTTDPAAAIYRASELQLGCFWETDDSFVALFGNSGGDWSTAEIYVSDPSGSYFGYSDAIFTTSVFSAELDLFLDSEDGELEPVGSASAAATLERGDRIMESYTFGNTRVSVKGESLLVDGQLSLTTPAGSRALTMDAASCQAADVRIMEITTKAGLHGPKPKNDTPDRAAPLAVGGTATVKTAGAAAEPEAPCTVIDAETGEPFHIPIGRTAWWTFVGTGGSVTIDTSASDFDTVVGVYLLEDGDFTRVACVDDVEDSLQARVTLETEAGLTYYIQAGGYGSSAGQLVITLTEP